MALTCSYSFIYLYMCRAHSQSLSSSLSLSLCLCERLEITLILYAVYAYNLSPIGRWQTFFFCFSSSRISIKLRDLLGRLVSSEVSKTATRRWFVLIQRRQSMKLFVIGIRFSHSFTLSNFLSLSLDLSISIHYYHKSFRTYCSASIYLYVCINGIHLNVILVSC